MIEITIENLEFDLMQVDRRIKKLAEIEMKELLTGIGAEVETQTRRRISDEKTAPDGSSWKPWSPAYARSAKENHSLLERSGALYGSIQSDVEYDQVGIGSNMIYAAAQNFGHTYPVDPEYQNFVPSAMDRILPAREFLGLSSENRDDLEALVIDFLGELLL